MQMNFNMENVATMNMEEIRNDFPVLRDLNIPMFITGAVGIGKSDTVRSLARENFVELIPIMEIMCEECWEKTEDLSVPR